MDEGDVRWFASSISSYFEPIPEVDNVVMPFLGRLKTVISSPKIKTMTDQELDEAIKEEREKHALAQRHAKECRSISKTLFHF